MAKSSKTKKKAKKKTTKKKKTPKKKVTKRGGTTTKRTTSTKGKTTKVKYESTKEIKVDRVLVDNFVALQKVMVNLSSKFDDLSKQISKLLDLFEISAKALAQKDTKEDKEKRDHEDILKKLDNISQHAGLIGKGLALIHDINKEEGKPGLPTMGSSTPTPRMMPKPRPAPMPQRRPSAPGMQGYQRSISSPSESQEKHA